MNSDLFIYADRALREGEIKDAHGLNELRMLLSQVKRRSEDDLKQANNYIERVDKAIEALELVQSESMKRFIKVT